MAEICEQDTKTYRRTSKDQLNHYKNFLQKNPDFLPGKNDPTDPNRMKNYWNTLAEELNALRGPVRTAIRWKQTLTHSDHQWRSRARKLKVPKNLTEFEEKALKVFDGCGNSNHEEESMESSPDAPKSLSSFTFEDSSMSSRDSPSTTPPSSRSSARLSKRDLCSRLLDLYEKRFAMQKEADEERLKIQRQILQNQEVMAEAFRKIGEGLLAMSETMKITMKKQKTLESN